MGKIVVSQNVTLYGVVEDPSGEGGFRHGVGFVQFMGQDWEAWAELELAEAQGAEALLMGRRSDAYFAARSSLMSGEWLDRLNRLPKYVVSATIQEPSWTNATVLAGEAVSEVCKLRQTSCGHPALRRSRPMACPRRYGMRRGSSAQHGPNAPTGCSSPVNDMHVSSRLSTGPLPVTRAQCGRCEYAGWVATLPFMASPACRTRLRTDADARWGAVRGIRPGTGTGPGQLLRHWAGTPCWQPYSSAGAGPVPRTLGVMAMQESSQRYPLSFTQEWFLTLDQGDAGGTFGPRFITVVAMRVTGHVDLAVLGGALDDVVARHEPLRTVVIREADPPYQQVFPPCQMPLEVRDVSQVTGKTRDRIVHELILEAETGLVNVREVPLIKALLCTFDDADSVLILTVHSSVADAWSVRLIWRDLGALYSARRTGAAAELPPVRQYREYAAWQRANATSTADDGAPKYWQQKLADAREFTMPNDHGHPERYSRPYSLRIHDIEPEIMSGAAALAADCRSTQFAVLLSAIYVLTQRITGNADLAIRAFTTGRGEPEFENTIGLFFNCVPFRTDIADCTSFRDVVTRTTQTFIEATANELPVNVIEQTFPDFTTSRENLSTSQFVVFHVEGKFGDDPVLPIADGARPAAKEPVEGQEYHDIPSGTVWHLSPGPSGALHGGVLYNRDEFDESTVVSWTADLRQILSDGVREPDQNWRLLAGTAPRREDYLA